MAVAKESAPAVLEAPRRAGDHRERMTTMTSVAIPLADNKHPDRIAWVDQDDFALVSGYSWRPLYIPKNGVFYAVATDSGTGQMVYMHRLILGIHDSRVYGDHVDGDGLNNRRRNLRIVTPAQNQMNARKRHRGTSQYKGVHWCKKDHVWVAKIKKSRRSIRLGGFQNEGDAALMYDAAAREMFGSYALLNFPDREAPVWAVQRLESVVRRNGKAVS